MFSMGLAQLDQYSSGTARVWPAMEEMWWVYVLLCVGLVSSLVVILIHCACCGRRRRHVQPNPEQLATSDITPWPIEEPIEGKRNVTPKTTGTSRTKNQNQWSRRSTPSITEKSRRKSKRGKEKRKSRRERSQSMSLKSELEQSSVQPTLSRKYEDSVIHGKGYKFEYGKVDVLKMMDEMEHTPSPERLPSTTSHRPAPSLAPPTAPDCAPSSAVSLLDDWPVENNSADEMKSKLVEPARRSESSIDIASRESSISPVKTPSMETKSIVSSTKGQMTTRSVNDGYDSSYDIRSIEGRSQTMIPGHSNVSTPSTKLLRSQTSEFSLKKKSQKKK